MSSFIFKACERINHMVLLWFIRTPQKHGQILLNRYIMQYHRLSLVNSTTFNSHLNLKKKKKNAFEKDPSNRILNLLMRTKRKKRTYLKYQLKITI